MCVEVIRCLFLSFCLFFSFPFFAQFTHAAVAHRQKKRDMARKGLLLVLLVAAASCLLGCACGAIISFNEGRSWHQHTEALFDTNGKRPFIDLTGACVLVCVCACARVRAGVRVCVQV